MKRHFQRRREFFAREARFGVRRSATGRIRRGELDAAFERLTASHGLQKRTRDWLAILLS